MTTRNLTIMFTDIKGYTNSVSQKSRNELKDLQLRHERLLQPVFKHFEGNIIKTIGDAFLVCFTSPTDAVKCGVTIQEVLRQHNSNAIENERLEVRVAINSGEVEVINNDIMGEPVNIAARLESSAEAGEVYFTEAVYLSMNRKEAPSSTVGERTFKGIPYSIKVYKAIHEAKTDFSKRLADGVKFTNQGVVITGLHRKQKKIRVPVISAIACTLIITAFLLVYTILPSPEERVLKDATMAISNGFPEKALEMLIPFINQSPKNQMFNKVARDAVNMHINHLRDTQGAKVAFNWLSSSLRVYPWLESFQSRIPKLDTHAVSDLLISQKDQGYQFQEKQIKELLGRYPKDAQVPYVLAKKLQGKLYHDIPLRLYERALNKNIDADDIIFTFCIKLFKSQTPGNIRKAHDIINEYYKDKGTAWAGNVMDSDISGNFHAILNAWKILKKIDDPRIKDPYFQNLIYMINGYTPKGKAQADTAINTFLAENDLSRKKQLIAVARKRVKIRRGHMQEVERTLRVLEKNFKLDN